MNNLPRDQFIKIRVTVNEKDAIYKRADTANMDVSGYIRNRALSDDPMKDNKTNAAVLKYLYNLATLLNRLEYRNKEHQDIINQIHQEAIGIYGCIKNDQ